MQNLKTVAVIGPESTGKSTLCKQLASYYNTLWCPEYAREYLLTNGTEYTYEDLLIIAKGQHQLLQTYRDEVLKRNTSPLLFADTDMYVMKVWCEFVFAKCHHFILEALTTQKIDLYLLCNIDLPWVKDELREYPDYSIREQLFNRYKTILDHQPVPYTIISGSQAHRLEAAIKATDTLMA